MEEASNALFQWFDNNLLKSNPDKCHLLLSGNEIKRLKMTNMWLRIVSTRNYSASTRLVAEF